jgi:uncharacterized protein
MEKNWFVRHYESESENLIKSGKVLVLTGPRRVGKTELVKKLIGGFQGKIYTGTGDDMELKEVFASQRLQKILTSLGSYDLLFIDEAQRIPEIGIGLKILVDHVPQLKIIITGSSSFNLIHKTGEPLTGRQAVKKLFPISLSELADQFGGMKINHLLEELMIFGSYPEVLTDNSLQGKISYLQSIRDSYLLKDIFELENIRHSMKLIDLLKLLAFQIGHEVSLNELSNSMGIAKQSIERYLALLEQAYVIKKVGGFSRNLRTEVTKTARYYFLDNGIRNVVINNFNDLSSRNDIGMLWENFLFSERLKVLEYRQMYSSLYFWRTYDKKEIDLIEERNGMLYAFEFKYKPVKEKVPAVWLEAYPGSVYKQINRENFLEFLVSGEGIGR